MARERLLERNGFDRGKVPAERAVSRIVEILEETFAAVDSWWAEYTVVTWLDLIDNFNFWLVAY